MNRVVFIVLALALLYAGISLFTFVGVESTPETKFQIKPDANTVLVGITPWGNALQMKAAYRPLFTYLSEKMGKKFQLLIMEDYDVTIDNVVDGNLDISVMPPVSYVKAKDREPRTQYVATIIRDKDGKECATYKGYIVALKSRFAGKSFDDFMKDPKEYVMGFVTKSSSSGYAYPMTMMRKRGIDPFAAFKGVEIFDNHSALTGAVFSQKIDLGATWEYNLDIAKEKYGDIFTIVYTTPDIPGLSWIASKDVDPGFIVRLRETLKEIGANVDIKADLLKDTPEKGWVEMDERFYDEVREVLKYVGEFK